MQTRANHLHPVLIVYNFTVSASGSERVAVITPQVFEDRVMPVVRRLECQIQDSVFKDCGLNIVLTHSRIARHSNQWVNKPYDSYDFPTESRPWILANIVMPMDYHRHDRFRLRNRIKAYKDLWDKFVTETMIGTVIDL